MSNPKLLDYAIIGKFDDGKYRQILIRRENSKDILSFIGSLEGTIRVYDHDVQGIEIIMPQDLDKTLTDMA